MIDLHPWLPLWRIAPFPEELKPKPGVRHPGAPFPGIDIFPESASERTCPHSPEPPRERIPDSQKVSPEPPRERTPDSQKVSSSDQLSTRPIVGISVAFPYRLPEELYRGRNIARFAVVEDYHERCGVRLDAACNHLRKIFPEELFSWYCDIAPYSEVAFAVHAGLGFRGRNGLLITETFGSWVFLGEIITTATLPLSPPLPPETRRSCPPTCRNCIRNCPTAAISEQPGSFVKERCLSFITQKKRHTPEEREQLQKAGTFWGCDFCQETCPYNLASQVAPMPEFLERPLAHVNATTPSLHRAWHFRARGAHPPSAFLGVDL